MNTNQFTGFHAARISRITSRGLILCTALAALLLRPPTSHGVPMMHPLQFTGTEQDFFTSMTGSGDFLLSGEIRLFGEVGVLTPDPQMQPAGLIPDPVTLTDDPVSTGSANTQLLFDAATGTPLDIDGLQVVLGERTGDPWFGTGTSAFTYFVESQEYNVFVEANVDRMTYRFTQDPGAPPTIDSVTGAFSIPGKMRFTIDGELKIGAYVAAMYADQFHEFDHDLHGTITATSLGPTPGGEAYAIELDGSQIVTQPIVLFGQVTTEPNQYDTGFTGAVALSAMLDVEFAYHLEDVITVVPEPSSITLLLIGLAGVGISAGWRFLTRARSE